MFLPTLESQTTAYMENTILENVISNMVYPSLSDRIQSAFIDAVLIVVLMFIVSTGSHSIFL
jgi:hypothetical protein